VDELLCSSGQCYDPTIYDCVETGTFDPVTYAEIYAVCPLGDDGCGSQCYDPTAYSCFDASTGLLCLNGFYACGGQCYNPSVYTCLTDSTYTSYLCLVGQQVCNGTCYPGNLVCEGNTAAQLCCDEQWACPGANYIPCPTGLQCCYSRPVWEVEEGGLCFDPTVSQCSYCPVYNPNHPQTTICPNSAPTCCSNGCTSEMCCHDYGTYASFPCPVGTTCCGFNNIGNATCCGSGTSCYNDTPTTIPFCA